NLELLHALVARVVPALAQHRAEGLTLVHRDHHERAAFPCECIEHDHGASRSWASGCSWTILTGRRGSKRSSVSSRSAAARLSGSGPWRTPAASIRSS